MATLSRLVLLIVCAVVFSFAVFTADSTLETTPQETRKKKHKTDRINAKDLTNLFILAT
jgi:hypothetical protein